MRLNEFDYFRAIAILIIVAGHSFSPWVIDTLPEQIFLNLISGGTSLFVFISGFFFHHVFFKNFNYLSFLNNKVKNVFIPYLILSTIAFIIIVVIRNKPHPQLARDAVGIIDYTVYFIQYLWTGRVFTGYWYITFIMIIFIISPLFIKFIELSKSKQISIFAVLILVSLLIQRPVDNMSPLHSVLYFTPIYLLGIIYSINKMELSSFIKNKTIYLGAITLFFAAIQAITSGQHGYCPDIILTIGNLIHFVLIQKIFMIFFLMSILQNFSQKEFPLLKYLASISFAIYFLHPWVLWALGPVSRIAFISSLPVMVTYIARVVLTVLICLFIARITKLILGAKSRHLIGW